MYSMGVNLLSWQQKIDSKFRKVSPMMSCRCNTEIYQISVKKKILKILLFSVNVKVVSIAEKIAALLPYVYIQSFFCNDGSLHILYVYTNKRAFYCRYLCLPLIYNIDQCSFQICIFFFILLTVTKSNLSCVSFCIM